MKHDPLGLYAGARFPKRGHPKSRAGGKGRGKTGNERQVNSVSNITSNEKKAQTPEARQHKLEVQPKDPEQCNAEIEGCSCWQLLKHRAANAT